MLIYSLYYKQTDINTLYMSKEITTDESKENTAQQEIHTDCGGYVSPFMQSITDAVKKMAEEKK